MGWVVTLWELSKMPLQNVTYYTPFATDDYHMIYEIMNDLHAQVPVMTEAWTAQNQHFLGGSSIDTYHLMTNFPVRTVEDLRGRKIVAPGPTATWLEGAGAVAEEGVLTTYYIQDQTRAADEIAARYARRLASMQADGAQVYELPVEEKLKWLNGLPNIAGQWAGATEERGIPAREVLRIYMDTVRSRGGTPLRNWDTESD